MDDSASAVLLSYVAHNDVRLLKRALGLPSVQDRCLSPGSPLLDRLLASACARGHAEAARALVRAGADASHAFALCAACESARGAVVGLLLESCADPNAVDASGTPAVALASLVGAVDVVRALVDAGADVDARTASGETSLHAAAYRGHYAVARELLRAGADPDAREPRRGTTPLLCACLGGHLGVVCLLLEHGADPNAQTADGASPVLVATQAGRGDIVEALRLAGAAGASGCCVGKRSFRAPP
eukprot:m51a1_g8651 hypothetical protein (245) ;mRNA; f:37936-38670